MLLPVDPIWHIVPYKDKWICVFLDRDFKDKNLRVDRCKEDTFYPYRIHNNKSYTRVFVTLGFSESSWTTADALMIDNEEDLAYFKMRFT